MPVYREKNKKKWTKDGRSYYFKCYYTDIYGNRKQKESKLYKLSSEAKDAEREFLTNNKTKYNNDKEVIIFSDVWEEWFNFKKKALKSTSAYRIKKSIDKNILLFFKTYDIRHIKLNLIEKWENKLLNEELSIEHKNRMIGYLKEFLSYCVDFYDYDAKIVARIQPIKDESPKDNTKNSEWNFWTLNEFNEFIVEVDNNLYYLMFNFLYYTGLRIGEMIALTWNDLNFENKTIKITKTFTNKIEDKKFDIISPKTKNSIRTVDLTDFIMNLLKKHYEKEKKIYNFDSNMYIFGNVKHISPTTFKNHLDFYIRKAQEKDRNFKRITPHGFRHSHVSLLIYLGCDSRDVANRIGDTVQMVENTYYHMFPEKKKQAVNILNKIENVG